MKDAKLAFHTAVSTFSGSALALLLVSLAATNNEVWNGLGVIQGSLKSCSLAGQGHCWLCGMSHAFRAIWAGNVKGALEYNPRSIKLFSAVATIGIIGPAVETGALIARRIKTKKIQ